MVWLLGRGLPICSADSVEQREHEGDDQPADDEVDPFDVIFSRHDLRCGPRVAACWKRCICRPTSLDGASAFTVAWLTGGSILFSATRLTGTLLSVLRSCWLGSMRRLCCRHREHQRGTRDDQRPLECGDGVHALPFRWFENMEEVIDG